MTIPEIMTLEEVAQYLRVSERTVYDWAQKGEIPCGKLGTSWRFKRSDVATWLNEKLSAGSRKKMPADLELSDILTPDRVVFLKSTTKAGALAELADVLATSKAVRDKEDLHREILWREELMSTGIGLGVAVPHVRLWTVDQLVLAVGIAKTPLADYQSLDDHPVQIVCMLAARFDQHAQYLKVLSAISSLLKDGAVRDTLIAARDTEAVYGLLTDHGA